MKSTRFSLLTMSRAYDLLKKRVHASPFSDLRTQEDIELLYTSTLAPEMMIYPFFWRSDIWVGDLHPLFNFNELFTGDDGLISSQA